MSAADIDLRVQHNVNNTIALVLGGGQGTRLYPLTAERAKPAVPLCGRYRLVDIPLSNCINSQILRIYVLTQFNSASLHRHITNAYKFDNFSKGFVEILAAEQTIESGDWYQGTADAVRQQLRTFRSQHSSHYLILSGDHLYRMDYRQFMTSHCMAEADITVSTIPVTAESARQFGIMKVDENGAIIEFVEKPQSAEELEAFKTPPQVLERYGVDPASGRHYLASMGVYIFRSPVLEDILEQQPEWIDFGKHVIPNSLSSYKVQSHLFSGFWEDIGTVRSYYDVSMSMCSATPPFNFQEGAQSIYTHPRFLPGSSVAHAHVSNSIICEGGEIIDAELAHSIVGIRSRIFPGARVRRAILMGADYYETEIDAGPIPLGIGEGAQVSQAIIDKNACIGRNSVIAGGQELEDTEGDGWAIRDGIVIILKNARIPDGTRIGAG